MRHRALVVCLSLTAFAACSDDAATRADTTPSSTTVGADTLAAGCVAMPTAADLSTMVGVRLGEGRVTGAGTCEYLGVDDPSRSVVLVQLTDPTERAAFTDREAALGVAVPLHDPELAGATIAASSAVSVTANGAFYSVRTTVTDATPSAQVPLSVIVLKRWLAL